MKNNNALIEKLKSKLMFGIEIEAVTSKSIACADYHANYGETGCDCDGDCDCDTQEKECYGRYFYAESDGSLQRFKEDIKYSALTGITSPFDGGSGTAELITHKPFNYSEIDTILDNLKSSLDKQNVKLWFNASCGSHVHVSLKGMNLKHLVDLPQIYAFRRAVFRGMKQFFNDDVKFNQWKAYYFRKYAMKISKKNPLLRERYSEINRTLDDRIEVRSTHLLGVNNFEDMKRVYKIFFDAIIYALSYKPITTVKEAQTTTFVTSNPVEYRTYNNSFNITDTERTASW